MAIINGNDDDNTLNGTSAADTIDGKGGEDILRGFGGNDTLIGGTAADTMYGGTGNDIYYLDNFGDRAIELGREGTDEVRSVFSHTIGANIENLTLIGSGNLSGTGNALNNVIEGNAGNNRLFGLAGDDTLRGMDGNDVLDGGLGNDEMIGGIGNDVYYVGRTGDDVVELGRGGTDEVRSNLRNYTLGANVENLTFVGTGGFNGTGNGLNNIIQGGNGNDVLTGRGGNDTLRGGLGVDTAVFAGKSTDYTIATVGGVTIVTDNNATLNGNDGRDRLIGVDRLQFLDGTISLNAPPSFVNMETLDGTTGFRIIGIDGNDRAGFSVSSAGDVNGDGFDDVILGAPAPSTGYGVYVEGESYVVFGKANWSGTPVIDLATLNGSNGFRLVGIEPDDYSGHSVSSAGDVNGDGFADVIAGAIKATGDDNPDQGESYVVFGKANWTGTPSLDLDTLNGTNGFRLRGADGDSYSGWSVSSAGDVNGDGFGDMIIGSPTVGTGESYVVFGKASWSATPSLDLDALDGTNGFRIEGIPGTELGGYSVSSAGDVNGDGFADVIVGVPGARSSGPAYYEGESYVVFGKANWSATPSLDLTTLDGSNGFRLTGADVLDSSGRSVSSAGDVNGDSLADLIIGAPFAESAGGKANEGESYVVFGRASWAGTPSLDLATLNGANGFTLIGNGGSGASVSSAGDVNGDGLADLIVNGNSAEGSSVVYGKANWSGTPTLDLSNLDGSNGFHLLMDPEERAVREVSAAGDVNGDGFADLIVGAPYGEGSKGESFVVFGGNFTGAVTHLGGAGNNMLTGTAAAESFVGGGGNDTLIGNGGADAFQGGSGNDILHVSSLNFLLADGGNGTDTLALDGAGLHLNLTTLADSRTRSIERIDIDGSGNNTLTLSVRDVLNLSDESNTLLVLGEAGDAVNRGAGWTLAATGGSNGDGTSTIGGETYQIYRAGQATLLVDTDMTASV